MIRKGFTPVDRWRWAGRYEPGDIAYGLTETGWYWWPCFPGCLPDGDPVGPFDTEEEALRDAQEEA